MAGWDWARPMHHYSRLSVSFSFSSAPYSCWDPVVSTELSALTVTSSACSVPWGHQSLRLPGTPAPGHTHLPAVWGEKGAFSLLSSSCSLLGCPIRPHTIPRPSHSPDVSHEPSPSPPHFPNISSSRRVRHAASPTVTHTVWSQPSFRVLLSAFPSHKKKAVVFHKLIQASNLGTERKLASPGCRPGWDRSHRAAAATIFTDWGAPRQTLALRPPL